MPNVTYISFNRFTPRIIATTSLLTNNNNNNSLTAGSLYPDDVILLLNDHAMAGGGNAGGGIQHYRNMTAIAFMVLAWTIMLIGFTLCCCTQFCDRSKRTGSCCRSTSGDDRSTVAAANAFAMEAPSSGRCFTVGGDTFDQLDLPLDRSTTHRTETGDVFRCDVDVESLPSYTIVSGLPTYDDALEEFRKAGIILSPPITVIKIFENETKEKSKIMGGCERETNSTTAAAATEVQPTAVTTATATTAADNSICTCGGGGGGTALNQNANNPSMPNNILPNRSTRSTTRTSQIIELSPHQLQLLSQKRLSLQIAFNSSVRRNSRPRIDLYREANRNNHLRSRGSALPAPNVVISERVPPPGEMLPQIHRSSSTLSLTDQRIPYMHRGSLTSF